MVQNYKIYHNDKLICIEGADILREDVTGKDVVTIDTDDDLQGFISTFVSQAGPRTVILRSNCTSDDLFRRFRKKFRHIRAAGGIVFNEKKELLFIYRRGKWDLPKGKIDYRESAHDAAMREVMEETGLSSLRIIRPVAKTYHIFPIKARLVLKTTSWYKMESRSDAELTPQAEEDISEVRWLAFGEMGTVLQNTHASIAALLDGVITNWGK